MKFRYYVTLAAAGGLSMASIWAAAQTLGTYGTPGIIDMPTAEVLPNGELTFTASAFGPAWRNTMAFQFLPMAYGTFRYSILDDAFIRSDTGAPGDIYDRSFDIHFQIQEETARRPGIAVGLRDVGGTGIYSSEYLVATKTFWDQVSVTGGLGWGRLATNGGFHNPLCFDNNHFCNRDLGNDQETGRLDVGNWFTGDAAFFGGVKWAVTDELTLLAEYSSDDYPQETGTGSLDVNIPFNFGLNYRFKNGVSLAGYYMYGSEIGAQITYRFNPAKPDRGPGLERAAAALVPVERVDRFNWGESVASQSQVELTLSERLQAEGMELESYQVSGNSVTVGIENLRFGASAQAVGRTNRILANTLPSQIRTFNVTLLRKGVPITTVTTERADLYELEHDVDGSWRALARAEIEDAYPDTDQPVAGFYPQLGYRFGPYTAFSFFDPDAPIRYELGAQANADLVVSPGLTFSTMLRYPFISTLDDSTRGSDSVLPRVRSDWALYAKESNLQLNYLTGEYIWRPGEDLFARVTAGYLEDMYGGVSVETLWYPVDSRVAYGIEANYAIQRDFDMLFGFQDYDVVTGHASVYYDMGNEYLAQVDAGRYLAGDWGATFTLSREFNNGFKVGAFFTLTDVPFDEFGEGAFDKGITLDIPLSWFTGQPSRRTVGQTIRPVLRDGGARLNVNNRLYGYTGILNWIPCFCLDSFTLLVSCNENERRIFHSQSSNASSTNWNGKNIKVHFD